MGYNCLIIDDEEALAEATCEYFNIFDVTSAYVTTKEACLSFLKENEVDVILLDINLGHSSGFQLCKIIRETINSPILFISARQSDDDVLIALNIGGDDYIKKPVSLNILLAKVKVVLNRYKLATIERPTVELNGLRIDVAAMKVWVNNKETSLKPMEFKLFQYLFQNRNKVIPKNELFQKVWGDSFYSDGTLNVHIRRVREKIEEDPNNPKFIKTVWGVGYILEI